MATIVRNCYQRAQEGERLARMEVVSRKQVKTEKVCTSGLLLEGSDAEPTHQDGSVTSSSLAPLVAVAPYRARVIRA
jgi:hypothetical protein